MIKLLRNILLMAITTGTVNSLHNDADYYVYDQHPARERGQHEDLYVAPDAPPSFTANGQHFSVEVGGAITFPCQVENQGNHMLMFKVVYPHDEQRLLFIGDMSLSRFKRLTKSGNSFTLRGVRRSDVGKYVCRIEASPAIEVTHTLDVQYPPTVRRVTPVQQQVVQGSSVTLECHADGNPPAAISWSRQQGHLPSGAHAVEGVSLTLEDVDRHVEGIYLCTASNGIGQPSTTSMAVEVMYPPEVIMEEAIIHTGEGDEAALTCIVHGRPSPTISWSRGGEPVTLNSHVSSRHILHRHTLTISTVTEKDFGDYSCTATNSLGMITKTLRLTGVPKVPKVTSSPAGARQTSYTLAWHAESHTPIVMYSLQHRKYTDSVNSESTGSWSVSLHSALTAIRDSAAPRWYMNHTLQDLEPATDYEATVAVENKFGWSARSEVFRFYTSKETAVGLSAGRSGTTSPSQGLPFFIVAVFTSLNIYCF